MENKSTKRKRSDADTGASATLKAPKQSAGQPLSAAKKKKPAADGAEAAPSTLSAAQKAHIPHTHKEQLALKAERRRFENPTKFQLIQEAKGLGGGLILLRPLLIRVASVPQSCGKRRAPRRSRRPSAPR